MPAPPQAAVSGKARECDQIIVLSTETIVVEVLHRRRDDSGRIKSLQLSTAGLLNTCRLKLEPSLISRDFESLCRARYAMNDFQPLPSSSGEFMVIPNRYKGPAGTGVLNIGILQVSTIDRAIVIDGDRHVEVADLLAVRIT